MPAYLSLDKQELNNRVKDARQMLNSCIGCAWECKVNRSKGEFGKCKTGLLARISSYGAHHGEEQPLSGLQGSGTIFFTRCNLKCIYCQNYDISQTDDGKETSASELAMIMLMLQRQGCHNINLVSPSHVVPQIIESISIASENGLNIPIVYNTGGYDSLDSLKLLDGIIDIYMPDMKYADENTAKKYSSIPNYPIVNQTAVKEMHRQVGDLIIDDDGIATKGLLIRHLVLPNSLAGSETIMEFLAGEISIHTYINIMDQYRPVYQANKFKELNRRITKEEYDQAVQSSEQAGLYRFDTRYSYRLI